MLQSENDEAAIFLTVLSYSLSFWDDAITNPTNPWHDFINNCVITSSPTKSYNVIRNGLNRLKDWWNNHIRRDSTREMPKYVEVALYDAGGTVMGIPLAGVTGGTSIVVGAVVYSGIGLLL